MKKDSWHLLSRSRFSHFALFLLLSLCFILWQFSISMLTYIESKRMLNTHIEYHHFPYFSKFCSFFHLNKSYYKFYLVNHWFVNACIVHVNMLILIYVFNFYSVFFPVCALKTLTRIVQNIFRSISLICFVYSSPSCPLITSPIIYTHSFINAKCLSQIICK